MPELSATPGNTCQFNEEGCNVRYTRRWDGSSLCDAGWPIARGLMLSVMVFFALRPLALTITWQARE